MPANRGLKRKKLGIAVIYGGRSSEHEVSLLSAASVMAALDRNKYEVTPILIAKDGRWWHEPRNGRRRPLCPDPARPGWIKTDKKIDIVFPLVHGTGGEDGCLQGLLELAGVPYVGSGVLGSAVGMDKAVQKKLLRQAGLPVVAWVDFDDQAWRNDRQRLLAAIRRLGLPVFVKPANLGSSVGITKAHDRKELLAGISLALRYDTKVIVEKAVPRPCEIECSVIGETGRPLVSVPGEIVPSNEFYDYEAKYLDGRSSVLIPALLSAALSRHIRSLAGCVFTELEAYGLSRVDFLLTRGVKPKVFVNEINTIPGFTDISMFPKLWAASGWPYPRLLDAVIALAVRRAAVRSKLSRDHRPPQKK